jgi:phosphatidate cytidylyltransferase
MSQNLLKRIITSIILLILLFFINFSHQYIFILSILLLGIVICIEANNIFSKSILLQSVKKNSLSNIFNPKFFILNIMTFFYIFFVFCTLSYELHRSEGPIFFLYVISICFFTDIGGYVFGKLIGGKKLSKISPNKTISGTIGSFIFSIAPLIIFLNLGYLNLEFDSKNILLCLIVSLTSQLGDLFISFFKRKAKIKDTGRLLPGHGGVLDRVDGIIFAIPFTYFLLKLF